MLDFSLAATRQPLGCTSMKLSLLTGALATTAAAVALATGGAAPAAVPKIYECQHPLTTGQEAYNLRHVSVKTACKLVRDLGRWENQDHHLTQLYKCVGAGQHTPRLKKHSLEGWKLSITKPGDFQMSRGRSSFDVGGTDFPVDCS
jgi:hypothetical protein